MRVLAVLPLIVVLAIANLSCSKKQGAGANLALVLSPSSDAIIIRSAGSSCIDIDTAMQSGTPVETSISGFRVDFRNFQLQWLDQSTNLFINDIRITISGSNVAGSPLITDISTDEVEAILGNSQAELKYPTVYSSDDDTKSPPYYACGLEIGGITPNNPNSTNWNVNLLIEVFGTAVDPNSQNEENVYQTIQASASYQQ